MEDAYYNCDIYEYQWKLRINCDYIRQWPHPVIFSGLYRSALTAAWRNLMETLRGVRFLTLDECVFLK